MKRIWQYLIEAIQSPREQLTRGQQFVRHSWQLAVYAYDQMQRHRAEGMAAELTYRTIFALVPLVVLGLVMFRVVGGLDQVQDQVENQLYSFFGVPDIPGAYSVPSVDPDFDDANAEFESTESEIESEPDNATSNMLADRENAEGSDSSARLNSDISPDTSQPETTDTTVLSNRPAELPPENGASPEDIVSADEVDLGDEDETNQKAQASIRRILSEVTAKVANLDFKSIGVVGLLLFIYAAVALADSVEQIFNRIFDAPTHRPIHIRIAIHWSIITLGSGLLAMSLYMSGQVVQWFVEIGAGSNSQLYLSHLLSILASWVLMFLLYALMPNTHVSVRAAGAGAMVGATLWEAAKFAFQIYVAKALPYSAIYGSIGLIPLFLFWIYVTWMIILFGLIVTYAIQRLRGNVPIRGTESEDFLGGDPDWTVPIMAEIAMGFQKGIAVDHQSLADRLHLPGRVVLELATKLIDHNLLCRVSAGAGDAEGFSLARPAESIRIAEILELAHRLRPTGSHPAWQTLQNLKHAERDAAGDQSLADLIKQAATSDAAPDQSA